ncbi:MAG: hypothetical protein RLZ81_2744 [Pseudomonadota bacterium]|jgi:cytochrome bd-type quinol oxidase subunit 2|uniref:hypothetical protein n=1 Tax=Aquabacterium sp. TaxID=1872578 RepID=UPI0025C7363B|nr:hypothetical protein [Aquabacterium sp.]MDQ5925398.1 hypothetical protein [Pseudomonadota bacterium]
MTYPSFSFPAFLNWRDALCVLAWIVSFTLSPVWAGPGAHGPNGEHLDTPSASSGPSADSAPRFEAQTELFEVVGRLQGGELSLLIDRFETNEPVLKAMVEVASGAVTAQARFHADLGDYAVDDAALLKLLSQPGEHALVITVTAGEDSDLLDAVLKVGSAVSSESAHGHDHAGDAHDDHGDHAWPRWLRWLIWSALGLVVAALAVVWVRKPGKGAQA